MSLGVALPLTSRYRWCCRAWFHTHRGISRGRQSATAFQANGYSGIISVGALAGLTTVVMVLDARAVARAVRHGARRLVPRH